MSAIIIGQVTICILYSDVHENSISTKSNKQNFIDIILLCIIPKCRKSRTIPFLSKIIIIGGRKCSQTILPASAAVRASQSISASFSAGMRYATPAPRSTLRSATAAASGYTAKTYDKSITTQFVHNVVDKSRRNPTESKCFQWDFRVLRRKLCLKIQSISHAACRAKYQTL